MKKDLNYVEMRLQQWAEWYGRHKDHGIGYRKQSNEYLIMRDKGVMIKGTTQFCLPTDEAAEEIERLLCEFIQYGEAHQKMVKAFINCYVETGVMQHKAEAAGVSLACLKTWMGLIKHWLMGRLVSSLY